MGSDNLHHKRKAREQYRYKRTASQRELYTNVLIVCEGETEVNYIKSVANYLSLHRKRIQIQESPIGNDPVSITEYAVSKINEDPFDIAYCVFDGIGNNNCAEAIQKVKNQKKEVHCIISYPCFEYWILMHYSKTTRSFQNYDEISKEVKKFIKQYKKAQSDIFDITKDNLEIAIKNSMSTYNQAKSIGNMNPSTQMYIIIQKLIKISETEKNN